MAQAFYSEGYPCSCTEDDQTDDEEDDETVINAQETISAAIRLANNLNNQGKLSDVFLRHLRNAVIRMTEPDEDYSEANDPFYGQDPGNQAPQKVVEECLCERPMAVVQPIGAVSNRGSVAGSLFSDPTGQYTCKCGQPSTPCPVSGAIPWTQSPVGAAPASRSYGQLLGAAQSPESSFGEAWGWQNPAPSLPEGISLSDSTKNFWERGLRKLARSSPPPPRASRSKTPRYSAPKTKAEYYKTGAIPRRLFPDTNGRFPCECEQPATPCLVTGPIPWTPSPAGAAPASPSYSSKGSNRGSSLPTRPPTKSWMRSPNSSAGVRSPAGDSAIDGRTTLSTSGSIPWLPSPDSSLVKGASGEPNVTSLSRASGGGRREASIRSQFLPEINSTNVSGSWGAPSRALSPRSPVNPVEGSYAPDQSSGSIPSWRIRADRDAFAGAQPRTKALRSRSLSPMGRRRRPVAEWEFVPSEDSSMESRSWRTRSSSTPNRSPLVTFPDSTAPDEQALQDSSQCSRCTQSVAGSSAAMNTFAGFANSPEYLPLRYRQNWSIAPAGAQPGELSREESWRYL